MTVNDVIENVRRVKPNSFSDDVLEGFVQEVESSVYEYLGTVPNEQEYNDDPEPEPEELVVPAPFCTLYETYVIAKIDKTNEEYELYANNVAEFNATFQEYKDYAMRNGLVKMPLPKQITKWW